MLKCAHCDIRVRSGSLEHFLRARLCKICCGDRARGSDHHLLGTSSVQHSHVEDSETTHGRVWVSSATLCFHLALDWKMKERITCCVVQLDQQRMSVSFYRCCRNTEKTKREKSLAMLRTIRRAECGVRQNLRMGCTVCTTFQYICKTLRTFFVQRGQTTSFRLFRHVELADARSRRRDATCRVRAQFCSAPAVALSFLFAFLFLSPG